MEEKKKIKKEVKLQVKERTLEPFLNWVASYFPGLKKTMRQADMTENVTNFIASCFISAFLVGSIIVILAAILLMLQQGEMLLLILVAIFAYPISFLLAVNRPRALASKRRREIDKDILFAGRHMTISIKGGTPLFDAMLAVAKGEYGEVSKEMNKLVEKVLIGVSIDTAAQEIIEDCPSPTFKRLLMQLINSIRSGADIADSLEVILDQISREQLIEIKEYGQRLNPVVMFYLVAGVILPSLGASVGILILSFAGVKITIATLWAFVPLIALIQYMFLSYAEITRPAYEV